MDTRRMPRREQLTALERLERRDCPAVVSFVGIGEDSSGIEVAENGAPLAVTISLSAPVNRPVQVSYLLSGTGVAKAEPRTDVRIASGTRSLGNPTGTLTFRPGQTSQQILLAAVNDTAREGNEGLRIQLFRPKNCTLAPTATAIPVTILDDDGYTASLVLDGAARVAEGQPVRAAIQLSAAASRTEVFYVATTEGTATDRDYRPFQNLPVTILAGQTRSQPFTVNTVVDGDTGETDEFFILTAKHKDASFPPIDLVGVIVQGTGPAPPPTLSVADVTLTEGNLGRKSFAFTIRLSTPSLQPVSVHYATADGSATAGEDYDPMSGSVTFTPGQISKTVVVSVLGDTRQEETETFRFVLSTPSGAGISAGTATATILDDEPRFEITLNFVETGLGAVPQAVREIAAEAAARWSRIIVGDLPDVGSGATKIDDLEMTIQMGVLGGANGPTGPLANARPTLFRDNGRGIPYAGETGLNPFYTTLSTLTERLQLLDTITHEMGHALGYTPGAQVYARWIDRQNSLFTGANALREYRSLFVQPSAPGVPLDATTAHWSEAVFDGELMSPIAESGREYISRVTIGALDDMGYMVDYAAAEPYVRPAGLATSGSTASDPAVGGRWIRSTDFSRLAWLHHDAQRDPAGRHTAVTTTRPRSRLS